MAEGLKLLSHLALFSLFYSWGKPSVSIVSRTQSGTGEYHDYRPSITYSKNPFWTYQNNRKIDNTLVGNEMIGLFMFGSCTEMVNNTCFLPLTNIHRISTLHAM
jgi:hypothetical protein